MKTNIYTVEMVEEIFSVLTEEEKQLMKDTAISGSWGNSSECMLDENGNVIDANVWGFCTNVAKKAGHFNGRQIPAIFKRIYKKMCPEHDNRVGRYLSHTHDYWDPSDGSGCGYRHAMFIPEEMYDAFMCWATGIDYNSYIPEHCIKDVEKLNDDLNEFAKETEEEEATLYNTYTDAPFTLSNVRIEFGYLKYIDNGCAEDEPLVFYADANRKTITYKADRIDEFLSFCRECLVRAKQHRSIKNK